jgi:hypothetical protein
MGELNVMLLFFLLHGSFYPWASNDGGASQGVQATMVVLEAMSVRKTS